ncbi:hypothetical protein L3Q72_17695 [Vibrio sp. JC009]|uniref:hypothetical protein n=1 Tax=Vibrio sp. JC009 TaxID=2912314 RepID=UPI0023B09AFC|nr:hypothetical protein [Vibrio sp. JC009]WED24710.1 hypothetical protein L3Q72_17695 [Vibrio sp. JC009]
MIKNIFYGFYAVLSGLILLTLSQDLKYSMMQNSATQPQYVFTQKSDENAEKRKQEELEIIRQWAEGYDAKTVRQ